MKNRSILLGIAALLLTGSLAAADPAPQLTPDFFAEMSQDCPEVKASIEPNFVDLGNPHCGNCGHPDCSGASFGAYCGLHLGNPKYCVQTYACTGEGIGHYRCTCQVLNSPLP